MRARRQVRALPFVAAAGVLFAALLVLVRTQWAPLTSVDHGIAVDLNGAVAPHPLLVMVLKRITTLGSNGVLWWVVGLTTIVLVTRRRFRLALYLAVAGVGALILDPTLKALVGRLRPVVADPIAHGGGNSFPSGHALGSFVCYGALILVFLPALHGRWRRVAVTVAAIVIVAIGVTRIMLGVHYLSDVVGGWLLGVAWLGLTAYAFELSRVHLHRPESPPLTEGLEPEAAHDLELVPDNLVAAQSNDRTVGRVAAITAVAWVFVFGAIVGLGELVIHADGHHGNGNILGDHTIPHFLAAHRTPTLNTLSSVASDAGATQAILFAGLVIAAGAVGLIRRWRPVVFLVTVMFGELALFLAAAAIVDRPRPDVPKLDAHLPTSSYPSGHVAATTCLYVLLALLVIPRSRQWWRWLALVPAIAMPLCIASARLYRGMHHPTDVLGGLILAGLWVTAMYAVIQPNRDVGRRAEPDNGATHASDAAAPAPATTS